MPGWRNSKTYRPRATGIHTVEVANQGTAGGTYTVATEQAAAPPAIKGSARLDGSSTAEIPFLAFGRTTVLLEVKGPAALAPRITGLRSPTGLLRNVPDGATVAVDEFGEDGVWVAIVAGEPGVAGRVRLKGRPAWLDGEMKTR